MRKFSVNLPVELKYVVIGMASQKTVLNRYVKSKTCLVEQIGVNGGVGRVNLTRVEWFVIL